MAFKWTRFIRISVILAVIIFILFILFNDLDKPQKRQYIARLNSSVYSRWLHQIHSTTLSNKSVALPLLTIFTTFNSLSTKEDQIVHTNVLKNWAMLRPLVKPVFFYENVNDALVNVAMDLGWAVQPMPRTNIIGTPIFKDMFLLVKDRYLSTFYGYCNGDILFDYGLLDTLQLIIACSKELNNEFIMITGQRINVEIKYKSIFTSEQVSATASRQGQLFQTDAQDYFFMYNGLFPWQHVPDFVVGRPGYDNFLTSTAILNHVAVVDATKTLVALHQSTSTGNFAGHNPQHQDVNYNYKLMKNFQQDLGTTRNAQYETVYNARTDSLELWHRKVRSLPLRFQLNANISLLKTHVNLELLHVN